MVQREPEKYEGLHIEQGIVEEGAAEVVAPPREQPKVSIEELRKRANHIMQKAQERIIDGKCVGCVDDNIDITELRNIRLRLASENMLEVFEEVAKAYPRAAQRLFAVMINDR